jgi:tetratricopeptide (TPR) repeat protein
VEAWEDLGRCLTFLTRYREASEAWEQVERLQPNLDPCEREAFAQFGTILPGLRVATSDLDALSLTEVTRAYSACRQGRHADAVASFDAALALDPRRVDLWVDRGVCAETVEGFARAIECFDRALALDPEAIGAWYNRGVSLMNAERCEDAVASFERAVKLHRAKGLPPDRDLLHAHHNMASCLLQLNRREEALDGFDEVARLAREAPDTWHEEARRAEELKRLLFSLRQ